MGRTTPVSEARRLGFAYISEGNYISPRALTWKGINIDEAVTVLDKLTMAGYTEKYSEAYCDYCHRAFNKYTGYLITCQHCGKQTDISNPKHNIYRVIKRIK